MAHPGGRPTDYTPELGEEICEAIATSTKGLGRLCEENPHWPRRQVVYRWCIKHKEFGDNYAKAKCYQTDWMVEEMLEIAYDGSHDTYIDDKGNPHCDTEWVNRSRLKVDTIKWFASKLAPKTYGDKSRIEHDVKVKQEDALKDLA